jgi:enoyl-CoA hydratase
MTANIQSTFFEVSREGAVAHLEMNKPDKANSMSPDFWEDLPTIANALNKDPDVRAVVISGRGKHFTGGMDLASFQDILALTKSEPARGAYALRDLILKLQDALTSLETLRVPVIAATHSTCLGAGVDLISACDIRIASQDTSFGIEEILVGMAADVGTLQRLPKIMPPGIVRELAYTGRRFSAEEAKSWGLVNSVHADRETTIAAAFDMAHQIAAQSPVAIAGIKHAVTYARDHSVADGLDQIATWNSGMLRPDDLMKAIQAKMQKQQAIYDDLLSDAS